MNQNYGQLGGYGRFAPAQKVISAIKAAKAAGTYTNVADLVARRDAATAAQGPQGASSGMDMKLILGGAAVVAVLAIGLLVLTKPKKKSAPPQILTA